MIGDVDGDALVVELVDLVVLVRADDREHHDEHGEGGQHDPEEDLGQSAAVDLHAGTA